jgi:Kef-type K+ transport system membrane component KefB
MNVLAVAKVEHEHLPALLVVGLAIFFGTIGAKLFQRLRIPQVVGYICIGLLVGRSGLQWIDEAAIENLRPFSFFALGIIGFLIGGELHRDVFRKYGLQFFKILLAEGMGAFLVVGLGTGLLVWLVSGEAGTAVAVGLLFGAIASATAPAATVDVLWEYKAMGVLTTMVFAIVALDDGLALTLYGIASSVADSVTSDGGGAWLALGRIGYELLGGAVLGVAGGFVLNFFIRRMRQAGKNLGLIIGWMALVIGCAIALGLDLIVAAMALGATLTNLAPRRSHPAFEVVESFSTPIYVLFFVSVGARLSVGSLSAWMWILVIIYAVGRTVGKMGGAYLGARWAGAAPTVRKYFGLCLFSQAGVSVGLAMLAASRFDGMIGGMRIGDVIILTITTSTFAMQLVGPSCVKLAIRKAGEIGLNVTEEDLINERAVSAVVDKASPHFDEGTPMARILQVIAETDATVYPVIDDDNRLEGVITLAGLKQSFRAEGMSQWLVAFDVMEPPADTITEDAPLAEAMARMDSQSLEYLPVIEGDGSGRLVGVIESRRVKRRLGQEVLRRRREAESTDKAGTAVAAP